MLNLFQLSRRISLAGILLLCFYSALFAQNELSYQPFNALYDGQKIQNLNSDPISEGTVHILAVMVEFEPDDNRFTSGNGTFELEYLMRDDITIDPLPHDQGYFEAHLEFARNYYNQASNGLLDIDYTVVPEVFRLPNEMKEYSPTGPDDSQNFRLGNLARDVWELVAQSGNLPDLSTFPQDRTMFIIFHAGAGRDLELIGTTLDNTPQDIPSVYLPSESISRLADIPDFDGFPLPGGLRVTNSAVLPQTQSRRGEDVTGAEFVLELSINGILTANVGSFLGIPDLFNTETGSSGIGQFGLMDGAGIFSYYGLFPPLPSAWERVFMGWDSPFDISLSDEQPILLPAVALGEPNRIARHRISADEYFLVENRHRDPLGTGVELTFRLPDGSIETRVFDNTEDRFSPTDQRNYDEIFPSGVLINVSNFDWSLPGGLDLGEDGVVSDDDRTLNGGMLIWHIDEAVIRSTIDDNAINNNPDRRGIALQEADGAQDIGRPSFGLTNFSNGGPFDFWWSGNDFTVITPNGQRIVLYQNRFADDTYPNNRSNTGSPTYFEFFDFSDNLSQSSFRARRASFGDISLVYETTLEQDFTISEVQHFSWPLRISQLQADLSNAFVLMPGSESVAALPFNEDGVPDQTRIFDFGIRTDVPLFSGEGAVFAQQQGDDISVERWDWDGSQLVPLWSEIVNGRVNGILSTSGFTTIDLDSTPFRFDFSTGNPQIISGGFQQSGEVAGVRADIVDGVLTTTAGLERVVERPGSTGRQYAAMVQIRQDDAPTPLLLSDTEMRILRPNVQDDVILHESARFSWPAIMDYDENGSLDFIYINYDENRIEAKNDNAAFLWNFPVEAPDGTRFLGTPILADLNDNGETEMLVLSADSLSLVIHGYDSRMNQLDGFPLYIGSAGDESSYPVQPLFRDNKLFAVSATGDFKVWEFAQAGEVFWGSVYGNDSSNKIISMAPSGGQVDTGFGLLNSAETYNWPNPAQNETYIRFQTRLQAEVTLTVINMSGNRLYERQIQSRGGSSEEVLVDTSGWSSGVYYARVRAVSDGQEETKLIKIAVIR